jgi:ribosomal protein S18 acetylase RimI-like enzyme
MVDPCLFARKREPSSWVSLRAAEGEDTGLGEQGRGAARGGWRREETVQELSITCEEAPDPESIQLVHNTIYQYNGSVMKSDYQPLTLLLRDTGGVVVGGLLGQTEWGWLYVKTLAIREEWRNRGCGTRLLAMAETEARARGCHDAYLDTFSFQARPFYERLGYQVFGVLENFTEHTRYFMRKKLEER